MIPADSSMHIEIKKLCLKTIISKESVLLRCEVVCGHRKKQEMLHIDVVVVKRERGWVAEGKEAHKKMEKNLTDEIKK